MREQSLEKEGKRGVFLSPKGLQSLSDYTQKQAMGLACQFGKMRMKEN